MSDGHGAVLTAPEQCKPQSRLITLAMGVASAVWLVQLICGFRVPWASIVVSDADSGAAVRQIVFSAGGLLGAAWLWSNARLTHVASGRTPIMLVLVWAAASTFYSAEPVLTVKRSVILIFCALLLMAMVTAAPRPGVSAGRWITCATGIAAWVSVAASAVLPAECWSIAERPGLAGVTGHPNQLGGIVGIGLIVSLGVESRGVSRLAVLVAQAGLLAALIMSKSMTCLVFTLAGVAIYVALRAGPAARASTVVLLIPVLAGVACIGLGVLRDDALAVAGKDASLSGRTDLWAVVGQEIREHPVLGAGYGAFWREGRGRQLVSTWNPRQSHQAYLDLLLDLGLVGMGLVGAVVFSGTLAPLIAGAARGATPSSQQAALIAMVLSLCGVYALGESFLLKADKFAFFVMLWSILAMTDARSAIEPSVERCKRYAQQLGGLAG